MPDTHVKFSAIAERFSKMGEKTGWHYIEISEKTAGKIKPGCRKSFRVKGFINEFAINRTALLPMGDGNFILPLNHTIRKNTGIVRGDKVLLQLMADESKFNPDSDFMLCLNEDESAKAYFNTLPPSHRDYYSKWIGDAKTDATKTRRITMALNALSRKMNFGEMLRENKK